MQGFTNAVLLVVFFSIKSQEVLFGRTDKVGHLFLYIREDKKLYAGFLSNGIQKFFSFTGI